MIAGSSNYHRAVTSKQVPRRVYPPRDPKNKQLELRRSLEEENEKSASSSPRQLASSEIMAPTVQLNQTTGTFT